MKPGLAAAAENSGSDALRNVLNRNWNWLQNQVQTSDGDRKSTSQILEDLGHYEESVRQAYTGRYPFELLQNAHDACEAARRVGPVRFVLTAHSLLVANTGVAFDSARIESLTRIGSSEKARRQSKRKTIGYKGVGFTAVFEITDTPQVITQTIAFGLDRQRAKRKVQKLLDVPVDSIPARLFPFELNPEDWSQDAAAVNELFGRGAVTVIRLPYAQSRSSEDVSIHVRSSINPTSLLFLDYVNEVEVTLSGKSSSWRRRAGRLIDPGQLHTLTSSEGQRQSWMVARSRARITRAAADALKDRLWADVREVDVAVAVPWTKGGIDGSAAVQHLHVYFPTDDLLGRSILIHGDFYVDQSRRHIEASGPGGEISRVVATKAAKLLGKVAQLNSGQGDSLLASLAVKCPPSGYGRTLGELIDEQLGKTRFIRTASHEPARTPSRVTRLPTAFNEDLQVQVVGLIQPIDDIVQPGDDRNWASQLLSDLKVPTLEWDELADRFDGSQYAGTYDSWLCSIRRVTDGLADDARHSLINALEHRPLVLDQKKRWRAPSEVFVRRSDVPSLPSIVADNEVQFPLRQFGRKVVHALVRNELTSATSIDLLLKALYEENFHETTRINLEVLRFLRTIWGRSTQALGQRADELGRIKVPARAVGSRHTRWHRADMVYFGQEWTGNSTLESLYRKSSRTFFLAPPGTSGLARGDRRFLANLGVLDGPRIVKVDENLQRLWRFPWMAGWLRSPEISELLVCHEHPRTDQRVVTSYILEIDRIVATSDKQVSSALARAVTHNRPAIEHTATITCTSSEHRGRRRGKQVTGPQEWLLRTAHWIPVIHDPSGADRRGLDEVWCDVPRGQHGAILVPKARFPLELARELGVTTPERASTDIVELALTDLANAFPILQDAPAVAVETAKWLLIRLNRTVRRKREQRVAPRLPALMNGEHVWTTDPAIPDLVEAELLDELAVLPRGHWEPLRRVYGFERTSDVVNVDVITGGSRRFTETLSLDRRAQIMAALVNAGADERQVAFRLSKRNLREIHVSSIELRLTLSGSDAEVHLPRRNYLQRRLGARGQLIGASLFLSEPTLVDGAHSVASQLANYLDMPEASPTIAWQLIPGGSEATGVMASDIADAKRALKRHGREDYEEEEEEEEETSLPDVMSSLNGELIPELKPSPDISSSSAQPPSPGAVSNPTTGVLPSMPLDFASIEPPIEYVGYASIEDETVKTVNVLAGQQTRPAGGRVDLVELRNEQLIWGKRGEEWVFQAEKLRIQALGYPTEAVIWRSQEHPTSPYDIESLDGNGNRIYIEVKSTPGDDPTAPCPISRGELLFALAHSGEYWLYRVTSIRTSRPSIVAYRNVVNQMASGQADLRVKDAYLRLPVPQGEVPETAS